MASLENRVLQMEMLCKQKDTQIRKLNEKITELGKEIETLKANQRTPEIQPRKKRKAPTKKCPKCGKDIYAVQYKRHIGVCNG